MDGITCDACGKSLLVDEDARYIAQLTVYAAADVMEITAQDLARRDVREEIRRALKAIEGRDEKDLEEEVYAERAYDLCPACSRRLLTDPLKAARKEN